MFPLQKMNEIHLATMASEAGFGKYADCSKVNVQ